LAFTREPRVAYSNTVNYTWNNGFQIRLLSSI
jgi:hypothetical protein